MSIKPLSILLGDDDTDDCIFFSEALNNFLIATHLTTVHDGEQVMQHLAHVTTDFPDVLFLDINMPRKNGRECLSEIKLNIKLKQIPVVMFSTSFEQEVVDLLYKNGAQYFIRKPADFFQFKRIIQYTISLLAQGNISQPSREKFVLKEQNSMTI